MPNVLEKIKISLFLHDMLFIKIDLIDRCANSEIVLISLSQPHDFCY